MGTNFMLLCVEVGLRPPPSLLSNPGCEECVGTLPLLPPCLPTSDLNTLAFSDLRIWAFFLLNTSIKLLLFHRKNNILMVQENTGSISGILP